MVPDVEVLGVRSLGQVVAELTGEEVPEAPPVAPMSGSRLLSWRGQERLDEVDMVDVLGMADARFAVEVAAAGGHHLLLSGPKGCGKTTLAERIPSILPDLTLEESIEVTALHSLAGALEEGDGLIRRPPFSAPHHDASKASILGGGTGRVRPGEVSRAHCGVLLLDEFPLLRTDVIDALRQPLESGEVTIARGDESVTYPARGMVVFAANPCPCGDYRADARRQPVHLPGDAAPGLPAPGARTDHRPDRHHPPPRAAAAPRRARPRGRVPSRRRWCGSGWPRRAPARRSATPGGAGASTVRRPGPALAQEWPLSPEAQQVIDDRMYAGQLSRRGATRVHRLAWTVADLRGADGAVRRRHRDGAAAAHGRAAARPRPCGGRPRDRRAAGPGRR